MLSIKVRHMGKSKSNELFSLLYKELKRLARRQLRRMPLGQSMRPTALVHEAYVKLISAGNHSWESQAHFFAMAVKVMRDLLIDNIRRTCAIKRGGGMPHVTFTDDHGDVTLNVEELMSLSDALDKLQRNYPDIANLVLLRFLAGLTIEQIATLEGISPRTVQRKWQFGRAWLQVELGAV